MNQQMIVKDLKKHFPIRKGFFGGGNIVAKAVDGIDFTINKGETFSLVGESGCGKTTVGRCLLKLYPLTSGEIWYEGTDLAKLDRNQMLPFRKRIQMIFQDPFTSLNPRMTIGETIGIPITVHNLYKGKYKQERIKELLSLVGLKPDHINRYPHEFSGGQRQRIGIARALAVEPEFIICDEPVSALDVSIQAQIINLLLEFQQKMSLTYLFISHDLSVVRYISDKVGVMYLGNMVECADVEELYSNMQHPYTKSLFSAVPEANPKRARENVRIILQGDIPSPINPPSGCPFRTRCSEAQKICAEQKPVLKDIGNNHLVACHNYSKRHFEK